MSDPTSPARLRASVHRQSVRVNVRPCGIRGVRVETDGWRVSIGGLFGDGYSFEDAVDLAVRIADAVDAEVIKTPHFVATTQPETRSET